MKPNGPRNASDISYLLWSESLLTWNSDLPNYEEIVPLSALRHKKSYEIEFQKLNSCTIAEKHE